MANIFSAPAAPFTVVARISRPLNQSTYTHLFPIRLSNFMTYLQGDYKPRTSGTEGPSWLTFLAQAKDSLWSVDLFRCESIFLRSHWVMVVIDVFTRRIIGFGVEGGSGVTPTCRAGSPPPIRAALASYRWQIHCRGLFQTPVHA
jgi:hypothetical protein